MTDEKITARVWENEGRLLLTLSLSGYNCDMPLSAIDFMNPRFNECYIGPMVKALLDHAERMKRDPQAA